MKISTKRQSRRHSLFTRPTNLCILVQLHQTKLSERCGVAYITCLFSGEPNEATGLARRRQLAYCAATSRYPWGCRFRGLRLVGSGQVRSYFHRSYHSAHAKSYAPPDWRGYVSCGAKIWGRLREEGFRVPPPQKQKLKD